MDVGILKRTTFIVADAAKSAEFYCNVFGWSVWYDNTLQADRRFPPSGAPNNADVHLVILQAKDEQLGKLGLLQYLDPPFDTGVASKRNKIRMGEAILVVESDDIEGVYKRAVEQGATVVTSPVDWTVPTPDGSASIHLRSISLFDPNGIYMEISAHPGRDASQRGSK